MKKNKPKLKLTYCYEKKEGTLNSAFGLLATDFKKNIHKYIKKSKMAKEQKPHLTAICGER